MRKITKTIVACCCFVLLTGCHKEQQDNTTGIISTEYQYGYQINHYDDDGDWYTDYCDSPRIVAHYDNGELYFAITSEDILELSGGWWEYESLVVPLVIPESIIANVPFYEYDHYHYPHFIGYHTVTFTVTGISEGAFKDCSHLASVTLPNSIQTIGSYAFSGCSSVTSISFPDSLKTIQRGAFADCSSLNSIIFPSSIETDIDAFEGCSSIHSITIKPMSETINTYYTYGPFGAIHYILQRLAPPVSLTFLEGLKDIFVNLDDCQSLTEVIFSDGLENIYGSFEGCTSLSNIVFPDGLKYIEEFVFGGCTSLTNVVFPESLTQIGRSAFEGCSSLTTCTCCAVVPPTLDFYHTWGGYDYGLLFENTPLQAIYVPRESVEAYKTADGWSHYADIIFPIE